MFRNMAMSIFKHRRIQTTPAKAKEARRLVERLITYAKDGSLSARRHAARFINEPAVLADLFKNLAPYFKDRNGGYTQIYKIGRRHGDSAEMAYFQLTGAAIDQKTGKAALPFEIKVEEETTEKKAGDKKKKAEKSPAPAKTKKKAAPKKAE